MGMTEKRVLTVTAALDPVSMMAALADLPRGARLVSANVDGDPLGWHRSGSVVVLTFEMDV